MVIAVALLACVVGVLAYAGAKFGRVKMPERYWLVAPPVLIIAVGQCGLLMKAHGEFGDMSLQRSLTQQLEEARVKFPGCFRAEGPCEVNTLGIRKWGCVARNGQRFDDWALGCDLTPELMAMTRHGGVMFSLCVHEPSPSRKCGHSYFWFATEKAVVRIDPSNTPTHVDPR